MTFTTEYNMTEEVYILRNGEIMQGRISKIKIETVGYASMEREIIKFLNGDIQYNVSYEARFINNDYTHAYDDELFRTKEEAAKEWLKQVGLEPGLVGE